MGHAPFDSELSIRDSESLVWESQPVTITANAAIAENWIVDKQLIIALCQEGFHPETGLSLVAIFSQSSLGANRALFRF